LLSYEAVRNVARRRADLTSARRSLAGLSGLTHNCGCDRSEGQMASSYIADAKRLTHEGARRMMATAIDKAREAGIAVSCCIVDAGGHVVVLERMDGGRFHTLHSCTTKAVCAASNRRVTTAKGAVGQDLDVTHALGLALAAGPQRWTAMEGGAPVVVDGECIGGIGVSGGDWQTDERIARAAVESIGASWK
jgi:uncharacterized protein GlcG (DUF336 family)